jgi:hypothetical protein
MIRRSERGDRLTVLVLSIVAAVCFVSNFNGYYLLNVVLAAATLAGAALGGRRLWLNLKPEYRSYPVFFGLMLAFWLVVWFWAIDDFLARYTEAVLLNALSCAVLCTPLHWPRVWTPSWRPYATGHMLALIMVCIVFWNQQDAIVVRDADLFLGFVPLITLEASAGLAIVWRIVLRRPFRAITRTWSAAASGELVGLLGFRWCMARMMRRTGRSMRACASVLAFILLALSAFLWTIGVAISAGRPDWEVPDWVAYLIAMALTSSVLTLLSGLNLILAWPGRKSAAARDAGAAANPPTAPPRIIIRCPNGHRLRVPRRTGRVRCPECDRLRLPDPVFEVSESDWANAQG